VQNFLFDAKNFLLGTEDFGVVILGVVMMRHDEPSEGRMPKPLSE
jgi:hypothetical protein